MRSCALIIIHANNTAEKCLWSPSYSPEFFSLVHLHFSKPSLLIFIYFTFLFFPVFLHLHFYIYLSLFLFSLLHCPFSLSPLSWNCLAVEDVVTTPIQSQQIDSSRRFVVHSIPYAVTHPSVFVACLRITAQHRTAYRAIITSCGGSSRTVSLDVDCIRTIPRTETKTRSWMKISQHRLVFTSAWLIQQRRWRPCTEEFRRANRDWSKRKH